MTASQTLIKLAAWSCSLAMLGWRSKVSAKCQTVVMMQSFILTTWEICYVSMKCLSGICKKQFWNQMFDLWFNTYIVYCCSKNLNKILITVRYPWVFETHNALLVQHLWILQKPDNHGTHYVYMLSNHKTCTPLSLPTLIKAPYSEQLWWSNKSRAT